ncbi:MAG: hypothetical protein R3F44_01430 [Candidatus Competibacteraceae bacterium]
MRLDKVFGKSKIQGSLELVHSHGEIAQAITWPIPTVHMEHALASSCLATISRLSALKQRVGIARALCDAS